MWKIIEKKNYLFHQERYELNILSVLRFNVNSIFIIFCDILISEMPSWMFKC